MKDLKELIDWLSKMDIVVLNKEIEKHVKSLHRDYGVSMDLYLKGDIRKIEDLLAFLSAYYRDKMPVLIKKGIEKQANEDKLMTVKEASKYLNLESEATVYSYIKRKLLTPIRLGDKSGRQPIRLRKSCIFRRIVTPHSGAR
jgi:hypothetical protein